MDPSGESLTGVAISIGIGAAIGAGVGYYRNGVNGAIVGAFAGGVAGAVALYMPVFGGSFLKMLASGILTGFTTGAVNGLIYNSLLDDDGDLNVNLMRGTFEGFKEGIMGAIVGAGAGVLGGGILYAGSLVIRISPNIRGVIAECLAAAQQLKCPLTKKPLIRFDLSKFIKDSGLKGDIGEAADRWFHDGLEFIGTGKYNSINGGDNIFSSTGSNNLLLSECKYIDGWNSARKTINWLMNKNKAYGGFPQMSDEWVEGVIANLVRNGNDMGNKLRSAFDGGTLDRSITIVNEWGESFFYKLVNGSWTLQ